MVAEEKPQLFHRGKHFHSFHRTALCHGSRWELFLSTVWSGVRNRPPTSKRMIALQNKQGTHRLAISWSSSTIDVNKRFSKVLLYLLTSLRFFTQALNLPLSNSQFMSVLFYSVTLLMNIKPPLSLYSNQRWVHIEHPPQCHAVPKIFAPVAESQLWTPSKRSAEREICPKEGKDYPTQEPQTSFPVDQLQSCLFIWW